jgi:hypothetical protein
MPSSFVEPARYPWLRVVSPLFAGRTTATRRCGVARLRRLGVPARLCDYLRPRLANSSGGRVRVDWETGDRHYGDPSCIGSLGCEWYGVPCSRRLRGRRLELQPVYQHLAIRRLQLTIGQTAAVRAAWLRFPTLELEPLEQTYTRIAERVYRYESSGGRFVADVIVDAQGLVLDYGEWSREAPA